MKTKLYTLYARHCDHVLAVHPNRQAIVVAAQQATERRIHSLRVRTAEPGDYAKALEGQRCERCEPAGIPVPDPGSPPRCEHCDRPDVLGWHTIGCGLADKAYAEWRAFAEEEARSS